MRHKGKILTLNIVRNWLLHDGLCSPPSFLVRVMDVVRDNATWWLVTLKTVYAHTRYIEDTMTTPPMPSSSPAPAMDIMEMSPLPHKPSFVVSKDTGIATPSVKTPTLECSPMDSPMVSRGAPSPLQDSPMLQKENLQE